MKLVSPTNQQGFSLIELMIAILISTILLLGVLELFGNTFRTDRTHTELARVQENGRVAMELIAREVRRAGYQGCISAAEGKTVAGVTYPEDAILGNSATSFTVSYASADPSITTASFGTRNCDNTPLHGYSVTFSNNANGGLQMDSRDGVAAEFSGELTSNTQITSLRYGVLDEGTNSTSWQTFETMNADDWKNIRELEITLAVTDSRGEFQQPRTFTSVIDLRNRL